MSKKINQEELSNKLSKNKSTMQLFVNREAIYKWFIENLSKRTYRCPVKKAYRSAVDQKTLAKLSLL
jgi:precorrin-4 methylase